MNRRSFVFTCAAIGLGATIHRVPISRPDREIIMSVRGPIQPQLLGLTLPHEHIMVDFGGADVVDPSRYDRDQVFTTVKPYLEQLRGYGCRSLMECTPDYLGRDPWLLQKLSEATGLNILTNTGYYGARQDQSLPQHAFTETVDQLTQRWTTEWVYGIRDSGVRPGFVKIGVDEGNLSEIDEKLVRAAARTHARTGMTIGSHTGPAAGAFDQLRILEEERISPTAWIWIHAQNEKDLNAHVEAAKRGAWISFDGLADNRIDEYLNLISNMQNNGLLKHVLISHDAGWYHVGEANGGTFRPFDTLFTKFIPALKETGLTDDDLLQLLVANPKAAFTIRIRNS